MTVFTEPTHAGEFILSEGPGTLSRENVTVTVVASTTIPAGAVLALSGGKYVRMTKSLVDANAAMGILYAPLTNAGVAPADQTGVILDAIAEVRGAALDWNGAVRAVVLDAMDNLRTQAIKVRDYTPPADGS